MDSTQATQHDRATATNPLSSLSEAVDIQSALKNWRTWRFALNMAVQGYISACIDLDKFCTSSLRNLHEQQDLETALTTVDSELTGLTLEEDALCKLRASLTANRNLSKSLVPIHRLPPEILTSIFRILQYGFRDDDEKEQLPPAQLIAGTCSYWRRLAISTPSLWTQISITTNQTQYNYAMLSLIRSDDLPISLTVIEPESTIADADESWSNAETLAAFLMPASKRIRTLDINSWAYSTEAINIVLKNWLEYCSDTEARILRIIRPNAESFTEVLPHEWEFNLLSAERAESALQPLSVLELHDIVIPWGSTAYHGLVDLRLDFRETSEAQIPVSQLANILTSSPELVNLQINGLEVIRSHNWDAMTAVELVHLQVLYLGNISTSSCELLFPLIRLSNCLNELDVTLDFHNPTARMVHLIQDCLRNTNTKVLVCTDAMYLSNPQWALSLSIAIRSLKALLLLGFALPNESEADVMALESRLDTDDSESHETTTPSLPHLFLIASGVTLQQIKTIVRRYGVRVVQLDACSLKASTGGNEPKGMKELKDHLREIFPDVVFIVGQGDTTT
ncbi:hypothetical protein FRC07_007977, partial [Ceratobasidium sp. 392]